MHHNLNMGTILSAAKVSSPLSVRLEVILVAVIVCGAIFELVRRKRLMERYAILWLVAGTTVLVLGIWKGLLTRLAHAVGIYYAPSALFAVTFMFVLVMLVHFSTTVSRLWDQNKLLAQRVALLQERLEHSERGAGAPDRDEARAEELSGARDLAGQAAGAAGTPHAPPRAPSR